MRTWARGTFFVAMLSACGVPDAAPPSRHQRDAAVVDEAGASDKTDATRAAPATVVAPSMKPPVESAFLRDVLADPLVGVEWVESPPFLVMQERPVIDTRDTRRGYDNRTGAVTETPTDGTVNPAKVNVNTVRAARAKSLAQRHARLAAELLRHFRELVGEPLKLPDVAAKPIPLLALWTDASWAKWANGPGASRPGYVRGFVRGQEFVTWHFGSDAIMREDEIHCAGGRVQKAADLDFCNELAHLLLHRAATALQGDDEKAWASEGPLWLFEGTEDLLSVVDVDENDTDLLAQTSWNHGGILLEHVLSSRASRDIARKWTITEFMKPKDLEGAGIAGERFAPGQGRGMHAAYCSRVWAFCHFLWNYDAGKYRSKLLMFLGDALKGGKSSDDFARLMGRPSVDDWGDVEREYEWYWMRLTSRKAGVNRVTNQPERPSTDAPTGKVEDDVDFCEMWSETHKSSGGK